MTRDEIIRMAQDCWPSDRRMWSVDADIPRLERFAALVAAAEREECAKVCDTLGVHPALNVYAGGPDWYKHAKALASAIRARQ